MPIYEFRCQDCSGKFDELVGFNKMQIEINCPECRSNNVQRLMSTFGFSSGAVSSASSGSCSCGSCSGKNCSHCH